MSSFGPRPAPTIIRVEWDPTTDWIMILVTAAGVVATIVIAILTLRANQKASAAQARADDALRRAIADNAAASDRQVEALRDAVRGANAPQAEPETLDIEWKLDRDLGRNKWLIRNMGPAAAHEVSLRGESEQDAQDIYVPGPESRDLDRNDIIQFSVDRSLASPPANVALLEWSDALGNRHSKRFVVS
tara:strand:+ start:371 stop:937 length:567 start_codon:yes stop_codon:yes gene_type:complete